MVIFFPVWLCCALGGDSIRVFFFFGQIMTQNPEKDGEFRGLFEGPFGVAKRSRLNPFGLPWAVRLRKGEKGGRVTCAVFD